MNSLITDFVTSIFHLIPKMRQEDALQQLLRHTDINSHNVKNETILHILARQGNAGWMETYILAQKNSDINLDIKGPDGNSPLMIAAEYGYLDVLELLIKRGADVNVKNFARCNALHLATMNNHVNCVKKLVSSKCNVNSQDLSGLTPLMIATFCGHEEIFGFLLECDADVNLRDVWGQNSLHYAVSEGNLDFVKKLAKADIELNTLRSTFNVLTKRVNSCRTPLMVAAEKGFDKIVEFLLEHQVIDNMVNENFMNAQLLAAFNGHMECFQKLGAINEIVRSTTLSLTPLMAAAQGARMNIINYLLDRKYNIDFSGNYGNAVNYLFEGAANKYPFKIPIKILKLFIGAGLNINLKAGYNETPLMVAAGYGSNFKVVRLLCSSGADINERDKFGKSALHYAVENQNFLAVKELVKYKINVDFQDVDGRTALHTLLNNFGRSSNVNKIATFLILSDANIHICDKNKINALNSAVGNMHITVAKQLILARIDKDLKLYGETPLIVAIRYSHFNIAHLLINSGANVNIRGPRGKSTFEYALERNNLKLIKDLVRAEVDIEIPQSFKSSKNITEFLLTTCGNNHQKFSKYGLDALYFSVSCGSMTMTQKLIGTIDNIDFEYPGEQKTLLMDFEYPGEQKTLLMEAASQGHYEILAFLLESGADANYLNRTGRKALHFAKNLLCAQALVKAGTLFDSADSRDYTPLMAAARLGQKEIVSYLIKLDLKELKKNNYNAWREALLGSGDMECVELLDSDLKQKDYESFFLGSFESCSCLKGFELLEYFMKRNINLNIRDIFGNGVIHYVRDERCLSHILANGQNVVNIDMANNDGETALILAIKQHDYHKLKLLINFGANVNQQDKNGRNVLHHLFSVNPHDRRDILMMLLNSGINVNAADKNRKTPLMVVIEKCSYLDNDDNLLLESGADCNIRDDCGRTPLMLAIVKGKTHLLPLLVRAGADINSRENNGKTALILAVEKQYEQTVAFLLGSEADVNVKDTNNQTPLMLAVLQENLDIVNMLLKYKADVKIRDKNGNDAFDLACSKRFVKGIKLLAEYLE